MPGVVDAWAGVLGVLGWWWKGRAGASHYCRVRLCRSLGNPSQSTHIQLLPLNQFEAAATSHLSQQPVRGTGPRWATAPPNGGRRVRRNARLGFFCVRVAN